MSVKADAAAGACRLSRYAERAEWQLGDTSARIWIGGRVTWQIERRHARHGSIERGRPARAPAIRPERLARATQTTTPSRPARSAGEDGEAIKIRAQDGRVHLRGLPAERHRRLHLGLLHAASDGYVEVVAG